MHSGAPFAKKGGSDLSLPKMDVPIDLLQWEIFLPEQYKVKDFGGDAIAAKLLPASSLDVSGAEGDASTVGNGYPVGNFDLVSLLPGQLGGIIIDPSGAVVPNAQVTVTHVDTGAVRNVMTDSAGRWIVSNLSSGRVKISVNDSGFKQLVAQINYDGSRPISTSLALSLAAATETVEVTAQNGRNFTNFESIQRDARKNAEKQQLAASSNVINLQQRISGVLPIRVDVPRAGNSYHFVRPLVLDEETKVTFTYKSK
jgi:NOL1/NOP2/fmu family ribosome biogenesis protein